MKSVLNFVLLLSFFVLVHDPLLAQELKKVLQASLGTTNQVEIPVSKCKLITGTVWMGQAAISKNAAKQQVRNVGMLQKKLDELGYFGDKDRLDKGYDLGFFDHSTKDALREYQATNLLNARTKGSLDSITLEHMNKYEFCNANPDYAGTKLDKQYLSPDTSIAFRYSSETLKLAKEIKLNEARSFRTYLQTCNVDEYSRDKFLLYTLCYKKEAPDSNFLGASLGVAVLSDKKTSSDCASFDEKSIEKGIENINGYDFYKSKTQKSGLGNILDITKYRIFNRDKCLEFTLKLESSRVVADDGTLPKTLKNVAGKLKVPLENIYFK